MRVRVAQCLCGPARHALIAMPTQDDTLTNEEICDLLKVTVQEVLAGRGADLGLPARMNPWCALCGATAATWVYEVALSVEFRDWEHAQQVLKENEKDQQISAALMSLLGATYDAKRNPMKES